MNWIKYEKNSHGKMPELELHSPATETVWIRTDNPYADRYGTGYYEYGEDGPGSSRWYYSGCAIGFNVTHWSTIEPPEGLRW